EPNRIRAWLAFWNNLQTISSFAAVPMLCIKFPPAVAGWKDCPPGQSDQALFANDVIWKMIRDIATRTKGRRIMAFFTGPAGDPELQVPPMLHSVREEHVEKWLADYLDRTNVERASRIKFKLFETAKYGLVPLREFATSMTDVFCNATG